MSAPSGMEVTLNLACEVFGGWIVFQVCGTHCGTVLLPALADYFTELALAMSNAARLVKRSLRPRALEESPGGPSRCAEPRP